MRQYTLSLITGILLLLVGVAMFNWFMDPYGMFGSPTIEGINAFKIEANKHTRLAKAYQVEKIQPNVIFLASSRGLVVPEEYFSRKNETALNLSLASGSMYELFRYFQHAHATRSLKRVVLALDESFTSQVQAEFSEDRLNVKADGSVNSGQGARKLSDMVNSLISFDALKSSLRTFRKQDESPDIMSQQAYMHKRVANAGGHRQMFRKMEASLFAQSRGCDEGLPDGCRDNNKQAGQYFAKMVEIAYRDNIELIIYFSPVHARYLEVLNMMREIAAFEQMKRFVVKIVETKAKQYHRQVFKIWDFSGYNVVTTETIPDPGNIENIMNWYWEDSHYTRETARLVFLQIMSDKGYKDFGDQLTSENIEQYLLESHDKRQIYRQHHLQDVDEIKKMLLTM